MDMVSDIAFFPWISTAEAVTAGKIRLFPFYRGNAPGDQQHAMQSDIDAILGAYANTPRGKPISDATILEYGDWRSGEDSSAVRPALFRARSILGFTALSLRLLYQGSFNYTNFDAYSLVVQSYIPGRANQFSFGTRRRDTGTGHLWSSTEYAFVRPRHVENHGKLQIDIRLATVLDELAESQPRFILAIEEFNAANTDSSDIPQHVELVISLHSSRS